MSQHDYNIANATFPNTRTDINNALGAIQTMNSGASAPSTLAAGQIWLDTSATPWVLKMYDGADHISLMTINATTNVPGLNAAYAVGGTWTAAAALTLPAFTLGGTVSGGGQQLNNIIIGASTPLAGTFTTLTATGQLVISGAGAGQIAFPASQNASAGANVLDDYEEGTYTATWTSDGAAPSLGNGTVAGNYTKIGNRVCFDMLFVAGSTSTYGTGNYSWALPFTASSPTGGSGPGVVGTAYIDDTGTGWSQGQVTGRSATPSTFDVNIAPPGTVSTARVAATAPMTWASGDSLRASGVYFVA